MPIRVDVLVNVHKRNIDNATRVLRSDFQKAAEDIGKDVGREIGDRIAQGIRSSSAEVNKAMDDATNSAIARRRAKERLKEIKKLYKAGEVDVETYRRAVEDLGKATRDYDLKVRKARETEEGFQKTFRERADVTKAANNALKDFTASHDAHLSELNKLRAANLDVIQQNNMVAKAFDTAGDSIKKSSLEYEKFQRLEKEGKATREQLLTQWQKVHAAWDKEARSIRDATAALAKHGAEQDRHRVRQEEHLRRQRERANNSDLGEVGSWAARNLGALTPLGVVTPTLVLPLGVAFTQVANAAVAASQGIALVPAALSAGAATMGTMHMATLGFSDTLSALTSGDLEKFAEQIQNLSPNAQQAVLTIQNLLPQLKGIQQATQDAFFADTGQMINSLVSSYAPAIQALTTSIAGSMNQAMKGVFDTLMSPDVQGDMSLIFSNISTAMQQLAPIIRPVVDAFVELTAVGSQFLPGMMQDIAGMTQNFANFISQARSSGDLANFMNIGWESIKAVGAAILDIGDMIYDVFGLKSEADIENFKNTMSELTDLLGVFLSALKHFFEDISGAFRGLRDLLQPFIGDMDSAGNAVAALAEIAIGAKLMGALGKLLGLKGLKGVKGAADEAKNGIKGLDEAAAAAGGDGSGLTILAGRLGGLAKLAGVLGTMWGGNTIANWLGDQMGLDNNNWGVLDTIKQGFGAPGRIWDMLTGNRDPNTGQTPSQMYGPTSDPFAGTPLAGMLLPGGAADPNAPAAPPGAGSTVGVNPFGIQAPTIWGGKFPVPPKPPDKDAKTPHWQSTPGTFELSNIPLGTFPGAEWSVPSIQSLYNPPGYSDYKAGKPGTWVTDAMDQQQAAWDVEKKTQDVEEARKRLLELRADNTASEDDRIKQAHNVAEKEQDLIKAQVKQAEAATGKFEKATEKTRDATKGLDDLSAMLDKDLGLSRGLPGLADNLVRFIGALAAAPLLGPLNAMSEALGGKDATGVGLTGILAAQGAFGPKFQIAGYDENGKPYSLQAAMDAGLGTNAPTSNAPGGVQNLNTGPSVPMGPLNLSNLPDAHGAKIQVSYMTALAQSMGLQLTSGKNDHVDDGLNHPKGLAGDFAIPGLNTPDPKKLAYANFLHYHFGDLLNELIYSDPNFAGTISMGKPYQYDAGTLADHQNHVHASVSDANAPEFMARMQQLAATGQIPNFMGGSGGITSGMPGGIPSGVTPVYVVNMPGSGMGDLFSAAFGGSGNPPGMGNKGGPVNASMQTNAQKVVAEGIKRGLPPDVIKAGLAIALQETALGTNPLTNNQQNQHGTVVQGMFQQDGQYTKYGDRTNPANAAAGFFEEFIKRGGLAPGVDPFQFAVKGVQIPAKAPEGYDREGQSGAWLREQWGQQATDFYNQFAYDPNGGMSGASRPGAPVWIPGANGGRGGYFMNGMPVNQDGSPIGGPPAGPPPVGPPNFNFPGMPGGPQPATGGMMLPGPDWQNQPTIPYAGMDGGGTLEPGPTLVVNNTGQNEHVVNPQGMVGNQHVSDMFPGPGAGNNPFATFNPSNALGIGSSAQAGNKPDGTQYGGAEPATAPGGGQAPTGGGLMGLATSAAATAADAFAPGSGAAVQIASQVAQRAIKLGGQLAGVGVQGLMETFLPTGASELANNNWLTRIGGAFAGVGPQLPNLAGKPPTPVPNEQPQTLAGFPQPVQQTTNNNTGGTTIVNNLYGVGDVKDTTMNSWATDVARQNAASMPSSMPQGKAGGR